MDLTPKAKFDLGSEPPAPPEQVPFQVDPPRPSEPELPRLKWAPYVFFVLIGFLIVTQFAESLRQPKGSKAEDATSDISIEMMMATRSIQGANRSGEKAFEPQIDSLVTKAKTDPKTQKLRVALRVEDKDKPFLADLQNLAKSKSEEDRAFAELYSSEKLTTKQTDDLLAKIKVDELSERMAKVHAKEKLGDKTARAKEFPLNKFTPLISAMFLGCAMLPIGLGMWVFYFNARNRGNLTPLGHPFGGASPAQMDRLFFAAACVLATYLGVSVAFELLTVAIPILSQAKMLVYASIFVAIGLLLKYPIFGWRMTPEALGVKGIPGDKALGWAFGTWAANIPILIIVMGITVAISQYLPSSSHPISEQLVGKPKATVVLELLFLASIVAPLWEEVVFRGFLFPAFSAFTKNPIYGAMLSSFCFAAIHPQGLLGVMPLATIAMMLCAVTYQTRSLIPGMIVHGVHNAVTLLVALAVGYAS